MLKPPALPEDTFIIEQFWLFTIGRLGLAPSAGRAAEVALSVPLSTFCHLKLAILSLTKVISNHALGASILVCALVPVQHLVIQQVHCARQLLF